MPLLSALAAASVCCTGKVILSIELKKTTIASPSDSLVQVLIPNNTDRAITIVEDLSSIELRVQRGGDGTVQSETWGTLVPPPATFPPNPAGQGSWKVGSNGDFPLTALPGRLLRIGREDQLARRFKLLPGPYRLQARYSRGRVLYESPWIRFRVADTFPAVATLR